MGGKEDDQDGIIMKMSWSPHAVPPTDGQHLRADCNEEGTVRIFLHTTVSVDIFV
jgi:hypothetical protein